MTEEAAITNGIVTIKLSRMASKCRWLLILDTIGSIFQIVCLRLSLFHLLDSKIEPVHF